MSDPLIPNRQLFDFEFPLNRLDRKPKLDGSLRGWTDDNLLPDLAGIDGAGTYAPVWGGWHDDGLSFAIQVKNKTGLPQCSVDSLSDSEGLRLCTDMRDARENRRASRYCQQFFILPSGGGSKKKEPTAGTTRFSRAREHAPDVPASHIQLTANVSDAGYSMEFHIPAADLSGFDPIEHSRIGLYYTLFDLDHGHQYLTVGNDLHWFVDPSTWATAVLT